MLTHNENHSHLHKIHDLDIETLWITPSELESAQKLFEPSKPIVVFLHEGLGSIALWRRFPQKLCDALGMRGLVFSRPGYGQSTPRAKGEKWPADFMHRIAVDFLPAYLQSLGVDSASQPPILFGHSDGATIALIHAASYPQQVSGVIALAPHIFVEEITVTSILEARITYEAQPTVGLRSKLDKYHADVDSAFYGWCDAWLSTEFRNMDIRKLLSRMTAPVLAIQGWQDIYGSMSQITDIAKAHPPTELLQLDDCGHSPHVDQEQKVINASSTWLKTNIIMG